MNVIGCALFLVMVFATVGMFYSRRWGVGLLFAALIILAAVNGEFGNNSGIYCCRQSTKGA